MKIDDFVGLTIKEIKDGIDEINREYIHASLGIKIGYPDKVDLDLCVVYTPKGLEVVDDRMQHPYNPSRLKMTVRLKEIGI